MSDSDSKYLIKEIDKIIYWRNSARKYLDNLFLKRNGDSVWQKSRWRVTKKLYHPKITQINHTAPWVLHLTGEILILTIFSKSDLPGYYFITPSPSNWGGYESSTSWKLVLKLKMIKNTLYSTQSQIHVFIHSVYIIHNSVFNTLGDQHSIFFIVSSSLL